MDKLKLKIFQQQVLIQCEYTLIAISNLDYCLTHQTNDNKPIFYHIQSLLTACGNVSKLLWGSSAGVARDERAMLRASLGVSDQSILLGRNMRNNFEHFDERIDKWWKGSVHHTFVDMNLGPFNLYARDKDETLVFRGFDPSYKTLMFWGEKVQLQSIISEIERLHRTTGESLK
jgi:hypothetical protein